MQRKIIKQGKGAYTVTLPISWVREHNLEAGSELNSEETEAGLLLTAKTAKKETKKEIDISEFNKRMILNILNQSYRLGYDSIDVLYKTSEQLQEVENITNKMLLGFEVVEKTKQRCLLQNIAEPNEEKFDVILRKIFLQILSLTEEIEKDFKNKAIISKRFEQEKIQIDKLTNYARRAIIKKAGKKAPLLYGIINQLSLITHAFAYMYEYSAIKKVRPKEKTMNHFSAVKEMFSMYYNAFYKNDFVLLNEIGQKKAELFQENDLLLEKTTGPETVLLAYCREAIRLIHMCTPATIGYYL